jgi:predicted nuclease with TOPRIM domain
MEEGIKQLIDMVANLKMTMLDKFAQVEKKLEEHDRKFEEIDERFEQVDRRFEQIDERFEQVDRRFDRIEEKFTNSLKLIGHDVQNNKRHLDKIENNDDYYNVSE